MLKILRIGSTPSLDTPGAGQAVWNLANTNEFKTHLITYLPPLIDFKNDNLDIYVVPFDNPIRPKSGGYLLLVWKMLARILLLIRFAFKVIYLCRKKKFDILHVHSPMHFIVCLYFKLVSGCKIVLTIHGSEIILFSKYNFLKFILNIYDKIFVVSHEQLNILVKLIGDKVSFIPNAVDSIYLDTPRESFNYQDDTVERKKLNLISVGGLRWQKNYQMLIESISLSKYRDQIELIHIGEGPEQAKLSKLAKLKNVEVDFKGTLNKVEIIKELDKSDLFVLTSVVEGAPKALIEAMARGLYCITTDVGECSSILGSYGHCLKDFNPETLAAQINNFYDRPLSFNSDQIKILTKKYTWKRYIDLHLKFYNKLVFSNFSKN